MAAAASARRYDRAARAGRTPKPNKGNIILMHDGGGDRSHTVAALPRMIDGLRAEGYQFVSVSDLLGKRARR